MKAKITDIRIQRAGDGGGGGGTGPTPPQPPKPENVDIWNDDQNDPPPRNPDGTPEGGGEGEGEGQYKQVWVSPLGPYSIGEVVPKGTLEDEDDTGGGDGTGDIESSWENTLAGGIGNAPAGIRRALERLKKPVVDWRGALDRFIDEAISKSKYDLPNRRFLSGGEAQYGYKTYKEDLNSVVIAIDTSGSISRSMIETFLSEVMGIVDIYTPQKTVILYCDTTVYTPDILEPGDKPDFNKIKGGGGTNFWPPFDWVKKNILSKEDPPSVFIYFTDGEATFPSESQYEISQYADRCIWVFLTFNGEPYPNPQPFGERIDIALANKSITQI
jgi:hypothetical protein